MNNTELKSGLFCGRSILPPYIMYLEILRLKENQKEIIPAILKEGQEEVAGDNWKTKLGRMNELPPIINISRKNWRRTVRIRDRPEA